MSTSAVVTGAGRGIGLAFAHRLAAAGHRVVLTDLDGEAAERAAAEVGHGAIGIHQDVADVASADRVAAQAAQLGRLAVWVNNAGVLFAGDAWESSEHELTTILDVNVRGVMAGCGAAVREMSTDGGRILNIASISSLSPVPGLAMYAATKAAVLSYTTSLQGDLRHAKLPISVKALCPDVVRTSMVTDREQDPGAAMLFSGPKPLDADRVADAGMALMDSRQLFRVVPRWRGALARSTDAAPAAGLRALSVMRWVGERRQSKG